MFSSAEELLKGTRGDFVNEDMNQDGCDCCTKMEICSGGKKSQ